MKHAETARRLALALKQKNLIAQELSDKADVGKASISQYLNGSHKPSNISSQKMAEVLDVNPLWLMGFDVPMESHTSDPTPLSSSQLTPAEQSLLTDFRQLNDEGQDKVCEYTSDLVASGRYIKNNENGMVEEKKA